MLDYSQISQDLFIGITPLSEDYPLLYKDGVRLVINMRFGQKPHPSLSDEPLQFLWLKTFDNPFMLIPIKKLLTGVHAALGVISNGGKVYSHCAKGRHRSVAMGAAILIAQGHTARDAMALIKQMRPISDPDMFYIRSRIYLFERTWREMHPAIR